MAKADVVMMEEIWWCRKNAKGSARFWMAEYPGRDYRSTKGCSEPINGVEDGAEGIVVRAQNAVAQPKLVFSLLLWSCLCICLQICGVWAFPSLDRLVIIDSAG